MRKFLVSYDLKAPGRNYDSLYEVLKSASSCWHNLESTWIIYSNTSIQTWCDRITSTLDKNDRFLIVHFDETEYNGFLPQEAWDWIKQHPDKY
jgi:hypothetical protein